ncbi:MAG TPA: zf-HC2 domain-containing protein, partial [Ardenticatenaceae bacterium]|nr:zf-HC2 domain-containing protein [Ardenticatenaceae bacterium]
MGPGHIPYEQLIAYAAGELHWAQAVLVTHHVDGCDACRKTVARFRVARALLGVDPGEPAPPQALARAKALFPEQRAGRDAGQPQPVRPP